MKRHKGKIIAAALILCLLAAAYFWGGNYAGGDISSPAGTAMPDSSQVKPAETEKAKPPTPSPAEQAEGEIKGADAKKQDTDVDAKTGKDEYLTAPVPMGKPLPAEPQEAVVKDKAYTCILSVRCDTLLDNMELLAPEKRELVPKDGVIFPATEVTFYEGESVFNLLQREMKKNKIHMESRFMPVYNSAYVIAINNLYEFDAGELSGWKYKVNGRFPNYGPSRYQLKPGDLVEWVYSCDLGRDVGAYYANGGN